MGKYAEYDDNIDYKKLVKGNWKFEHRTVEPFKKVPSLGSDNGTWFQIYINQEVHPEANSFLIFEVFVTENGYPTFKNKIANKIME